MSVSIKFHGMQRVITNTDRLDMPAKENMTVQDALEYIRQRYPDFPLEDGMTIITVNHAIATPDRILKDKDTISILPMIAGG
jgi:molybdopterin converting factor small subunit